MNRVLGRQWAVLVVGLFVASQALAQSKSDYCYDNPSLSDSPKPNIVLLLDSSGSMGWDAYDNAYDTNTEYYGYAQNDYWYLKTKQGDYEPREPCRTAGTLSVTCDHTTEDGDPVDYPDKVTQDVDSDDDDETWYTGNYVNHQEMARIDVGREALIGGAGTSRNWSGNGDGSLSTYRTESGVNIDKTSEQASNPTGVIQDVADDARWGVAIFGEDGWDADGSDMVVPISKSNMTDTYQRIQGGISGWTPDGNTPLAEALWSVTGYFAQVEVNTNMPDGISSPGPSYSNDYPVAPDPEKKDDPLWYDPPGEYPHCQDNFVLYVTDGAPTADDKVPSELHSYNDNPDTGNTHDNSIDHTDYLEDVAFYARTNDLRSATAGLNEVQGKQNVILYPVYAFGDSADTADLLKKAAITGGFQDKDDDGIPYWDSSDCTLGGSSNSGTCAEWDADFDGVPDSYFDAGSGNEMESTLRSAITDILTRVSSGSTVATISTQTRSGGVLLQAYYEPQATTTGSAGTFDLAWRGHLRTLWTDPKGNIREDSSDDQNLILDDDRILQFDYNATERRVVVNHYPDDGDISGSTAKDSIPDTCVDPSVSTDSDVEAKPNTEVSPVWQAGVSLAQRPPGTENSDGSVADPRQIYFNTGDPDAPGDDSLEAFDVTRKSDLSPYWGTSDAVSDELIRFIRGLDNPGGNTADYRPRQAEDDSTANYGNAAGQEVWKMGAIVTSTPKVLRQGPVSSYPDEGGIGFADYYTSSEVQDREPMVLVGANDGMLHAFYAGSVKSDDSPSRTATLNDVGGAAAKEAWSFIPQNALPYLRWYGEMDASCNIPTVDYRVQLVDAMTAGAAGDANGKSAWQTLLIGTMGFGGKSIDCGDVDSDGSNETLSGSVFVLNVTDPENPELLWERSLSDNSLTLTTPAVVRRGDDGKRGDWYVVLGSGPLGPEAESFVTSPKLFAFNLRDGNKALTLDLTDSGNFKGSNAASGSVAVGEPLPFDPDQDNLTDAVYFGTYGGPGVEEGRFYRLHLADDVSTWQASLAAKVANNTGRPFFAAPGAALDPDGDVWVYGATGRFFSPNDSSTTKSQYFFGYVDECWGEGDGTEEGGTYESASCDPVTITDLPKMRGPTASETVQVTGDPVSFECRCGSSFYQTAANGASTSCPDGSDLVVKEIEGVNYSNCPWANDCGTNKPSQIRDKVKSRDGWYWEFTGGKRVFSRPAVFGGLVNVAAFKPETGLCSPGGTTTSYAVDYRTGTAPPKPVFLSSGGTEDAGSDGEKIKTGVELGQGVPPVGESYSSSAGGREGEMNTLTQPSTGEIKQLQQQVEQLESGILTQREQ